MTTFFKVLQGYGKYFFFLLLILSFVSSVFSQTAPGGIGQADLKMWLKADAYSSLHNQTLTIVENTPINFWDNLYGTSGSFGNTTPNGVPIYKSAGMGTGMPSLYFDGSSAKNLTFPAFTGHFSNNFTCYIIAKPELGPTDHNFTLLGPGNDYPPGQGPPGHESMFPYYQFTELRIAILPENAPVSAPAPGTSPLGLDYVSFNGNAGSNVSGNLRLLSTNTLKTATPNIIRFEHQISANPLSSIIASCNGVDGLKTNGIQLQDYSKLSIGTNGSYDLTYADFYKGHISEIVFYGRVLTLSERKIAENYLSLKYGPQLLNGAVVWNLYDHSYYPNHMAGVGQETTTSTDKVNTGTSDVLTVSLGSGVTGFYYRLFAHNGATLTNHTNVSPVPANTQRLTDREWQFGSTTAIGIGTGTVNLSVPLVTLQSLGTYDPAYQKYAFLIGTSTGDFSQARVAVMDGTYTANNVTINPGEKVTIGLVHVYPYSATFLNNISGLGNADYNYQVNTATSSILTIDNTMPFNVGNYLVFGKDNGAVTSASWTTSGIPANVNKILPAKWRLKTYGTTTGDFSVSSAALSLPAGSNTLVLLIDADGNFTAGSQTIGMAVEGPLYKAYNVSIPDGYYVALGAANRVLTNSKNLSVTFLESSSQLSVAGTVKTIYLKDNYTFNQSTPCLEEVGSAKLNIVFNTGQIYDYGDNAFNATSTGQVKVNIKADVYDAFTGGTLTQSFTGNMVIDKTKPEQWYVMDIPLSIYNAGKRIDVSVINGSFVPPTNTAFKNKLQVNAFVNETIKYKIVPTFQTLITGQSVSGKHSYKFLWDISVCNTSSYQFQLLRLRNVDPSKITSDQNISAVVDWSQALTVETKNKNLTLTMAEGTGFYIWRVRPIGNYYDGEITDNRNYGTWSSAPANGASLTLTSSSSFPYLLYYNQFDEDKNFIYSRTFTENTQINESIKYANGLQQVKQTQIHIPSNADADVNTKDGEIVVSQTVYDYAGRASLNTMTAPVLELDQAGYNSNEFAYRQNFISKGGILYGASNFDTDANYNAPEPVDGGPLNLYYTKDNTDARIPYAGDPANPTLGTYPYSRTLYDTDGTNRPKESGGVGFTHKIGNGHTVRIEYASASDDELLRIFGDEAPEGIDVIKTFTTDQNNITSITYTNKLGQVLATCLSVNNAPPTPTNTGLIPLPSAAYAISNFGVSEIMTANTPYSERGISSTKVVNFDVATNLQINYDITRNVVSSTCGTYCNTCAYKVTIKVHDTSNPLLDKTYVTNIPAGTTVNASSCSTQVFLTPAYTGTTSGNYPILLNGLKGKYIIEKIIEYDQTKADEYVNAVTGFIQTDINTLVQPIYTIMNGALSENAKVTGVLDQFITMKNLALASHPYEVQILDVDGNYKANSLTGTGAALTRLQLSRGDRFILLTKCCSIELPVVLPLYTVCLDANLTTTAARAQKFADLVTTKIPATAFQTVTGYTMPDFVTMITNMLNESGGTMYNCQNLYDCWDGAVTTYNAFHDPANTFDYNAGINQGGIDNGQPAWTRNPPLTFSFDIIDAFLNCAGRHFAGFTANTTLLKYKPYRYFSYTLNNSPACEQAMCNVPNITNPDTWTETTSQNYPVPDPSALPGTYTLPCSTCTYTNPTANDVLYTTSSYSKFLHAGVEFSEMNYYAFYKCLSTVRPTATTPPITNSDIISNVNVAIAGCNRICDAKYDGLLADLQTLYSDGNGGYINGTTVLTFADLCCTAQSLVEDCKSHCGLSLVNITCGGNTMPFRYGTTAELAWYRTIVSGTYQLAKTCTTGYTQVSAPNLSVPLRCSNNGVEAPRVITKIWDKTSGGNNLDEIKFVFETPDQGSIVIGQTQSTNIPGYPLGGTQDYLIVKSNSSGISTSIYTIGGNQFELIVDAKATSDGGVVLAGQTNSTNIPGNISNGGSDGYVVKLNSDGTIAWQKTFGGTGNDQLSSIEITNDGGYIVTGNSYLSIYDNRSYIAKINSNGSVAWANTYIGSAGRFNTIKQTTDGYFAAGTNNSDIIVVKINLTGTLIWSYTFAGNNNSYFSDMILCSDGSFIVAGVTNATNFINNPNRGLFDVFVFKMSSLGQPLWFKIFGGNGDDGGPSTSLKLEVLESNNCIIGFSTNSTDLANPNFGGGVGIDDIYIIKLNSNGEVVWEKAIGGSCDDDLNGIKVLPSGYIYVIGSSCSTELSGNVSNTYDILLTKIDNNGNTLIQNMLGGNNQDIDLDIAEIKYNLFQQTSDGNYYVGTSSNSAIGYNKSQANLGDYDFWLLKIKESISCNPIPVCIKYNDFVNLDLNVRLATYPGILDPPTLTADGGTLQYLTNTLDAQVSGCIFNNRERLAAEYKNQCMTQGITDHAKLDYTLGIHHYTLYYYDRAGHLMKTIPPKGVVTLDPSIPNVKNRITPTSHTMATTYQYNSLGQMVQQQTPDGGITKFLYDKNGLLRFSENAEQKLVNHYVSYTKYDELSRIIEVGEYNTTPSGPTSYDYLVANPAVWSRNTTTNTGPLDYGTTSYPSGTSNFRNRNITVYNTAATLERVQNYLLNRVSYIYTDEDGNLSTTTDQNYTYFSYDPHGNVAWLAQDVAGLGRHYVDYEYDLISNKVTQVKYNVGQPDQFFHRYTYDTDNRITLVESSKDGLIWDKDGKYNYYKHGPLARTELGEDKIQGMDYIYTLQGWLKSVNSANLDADPGNDITPSTGGFATDVYGMTLGYFENDFYQTNSAGVTSIFNSSNVQSLNKSTNLSFKQLYNGNISSWTSKTDNTHILPAQSHPELTGNHFVYDQLNRILTSSFVSYSGSAWVANTTKEFNTSYKYDANGNITDLGRHGNSGTGIYLDSLHYNYPVTTTNLLKQVTEQDPLKDNVYTTDIDHQSDPANYAYDNIGNLVQDKKEGVTISWTVYGKVSEVIPILPLNQLELNAQKPYVKYTYDAMGNRVSKLVNTEYYKNSSTTGGFTAAVNTDPVHITTTYYVRDANGNPMAVYDRSNSKASVDYVAKFSLTEQSLYGSDRLGMYQPNLKLKELPFAAASYNTLGTLDETPYTIAEAFNFISSGNGAEAVLKADGSTVNVQSTQIKKEILLGGNNLNSSIRNCFPGKTTSNLAITENEFGGILFYSVTPQQYWGSSNVCLVYDANGNIMPKASNILSDGSTEAITAPNPADPDGSEYYLITRNTGDLYYTVIDMALPGNGTLIDPLGDIKTKNTKIDLTNTTYVYGKYLAMVEDHVANTSTLFASRTTGGVVSLVSFTISSTGFSGPVTMYTGITGTEGGEIKISKEGDKVAMFAFKNKQGWFKTAGTEAHIWTMAADYTIIPDASLAPELKHKTIALLKGSTLNAGLEFAFTNRYLYYNQRALVNVNTSNAATYKYDVNTSTSAYITPTHGDINRARKQIASDDPIIYIANTVSKDFTYIKDSDNSTGTKVLDDADITKPNYILAGGLSMEPLHIFFKTAPPLNYYTRSINLKEYELKDHLGNVTVVVSDRKGYNTTTSEYFAEIISNNNYYPFGMLQPGRYKTNYRYGFNGKEMDNEKGIGNSYDFGSRIYDSRIGKFLSLDPLQKKYPGSTPYGFANQNPIANLDIDGKYALFVHFRLTKLMLRLCGVSEVQANLISHYASVFADNPSGISNTSEITSTPGIIVGNVGASKLAGFTQAETDKLKYNPMIDYSSTKNSQSEDVDAQLIHGTRALSENTISAEFAVARAVGFAWNNLFASAAEGHMDNLEINSYGMERLGLAIHTFQDVNAHKGSIFHASWHGGILSNELSRHNEHSLANDIWPEKNSFIKAQNMTISAILIHQALTGDLSNLNKVRKIYTDGMTSEQYGKLSSALDKGGYTMTKDGDYSILTKKK